MEISYIFSFHRFVSYENVHVIGAYVEIKPVNCEMKVKVVSGIDAQVTNHGAQHLTEFSKRAFEEKFLQWVWSRQNRQFQLQSAPYIKYSRAESIQKMRHLRSLMTEEKIHAEIQLVIPQGETARVEKISTVHSSRDLEYVASGKEPEGENVCRDGLDNLKEAEEKGYETLLGESKKVWEKIWKKQDIQIDSKEDDAQYMRLRFALYHLQIMVRRKITGLVLVQRHLVEKDIKDILSGIQRHLFFHISRWQNRRRQELFWNSVIRDCTVQERKQLKMVTKEPCTRGKRHGSVMVKLHRMWSVSMFIPESR